MIGKPRGHTQVQITDRYAHLVNESVNASGSRSATTLVRTSPLSSTDGVSPPPLHLPPSGSLRPYPVFTDARVLNKLVHGREREDLAVGRL